MQAWLVAPVPVLGCRREMLGLALWCGDPKQNRERPCHQLTHHTLHRCKDAVFGMICSSNSVQPGQFQKDSKLTLKNLTVQMHPRSVTCTISICAILPITVIKHKAAKHGGKEMAENSSCRS